MTLSYRSAGVDIWKAEELVGHLKGKLPGIGGFSGLYPLGGKDGPWIAATTDGVGTKLKIAFMLDRHDTVGIDLVAMSVNDLLVCGAKPLFFLDYYAVGKLDLRRSKQILAGIMEGCRRGGMLLLGGETAEMPGFYPKGEYDLAGFAVGILHKKDRPDPAGLREGDPILGLPSSGLHSNGFSLARRALSAREIRRFGRELLTPTRIYAAEVARLKAAFSKSGRRVRAMAHITGGGLFRNLSRVLPGGLDALLDKSWRIPPIFGRIAAAGVAEKEMYRTFNMGIGLAVFVSAKDEALARRALPELVEIGRITRGAGRVRGI